MQTPQTSFKPLRSGALDRTAVVAVAQAVTELVSNPFVAGHWIVPNHLTPPSPARDPVSNPFVAGHWIVHGGGIGLVGEGGGVSNPFVAGHWIVPDAYRSPPTRVEPQFQTPS